MKAWIQLNTQVIYGPGVHEEGTFLTLHKQCVLEWRIFARHICKGLCLKHVPHDNHNHLSRRLIIFMESNYVVEIISVSESVVFLFCKLCGRIFLCLWIVFLFYKVLVEAHILKTNKNPTTLYSETPYNYLIHDSIKQHLSFPVACLIWSLPTILHRPRGHHMMTPSNENIFRVTGHLCGEFTGPP